MPTPPIVNRYYPALSSVVSLDDFPESLGFLKQAITQLFDKIHYKDLQYKKSPKGDAAFYSLTIVSRKLGIELFGSGISLVLNPDESGNTEFNISAFPVTVEYHWKILAYLRSFDLDNFSYTPQEFFELGLIILNVSEEQAMAHFINTFTVPIDEFTSPLEQFVNDLKQSNSDLQLLPLTIDENTNLTEVAQAINAHTNKYATLYAFGAYLLKNDLNETKKKVGTFFRKFIPDDLESYIKDILVPKAKVTLTVSAAIEFPRNILYPYVQNGAIWEREPAGSGVLSRFYFGKILLYADTQKGIGYNMDLVGDLAPQYSEIGNTGLLLQLQKLKIDLSDKVNIPEADADGRPEDFRGVYADALSVTLPAKWFKTGTNTNGSTLRIGGYNLLIGTGGLSGTFALEAVPTQNASNDQVIDFFSTKFDLVYPITGLINNTVTKSEDKVIINNHAELLVYLNSLSIKNLYSFKVPFEIIPIGQSAIQFNTLQEFKSYITDLVVAENGTMWMNVGGEEKGFLIGFKSFDITFKQNKITESNIKGALEIKKFVYPASSPNAGQTVHIDIAGHLSDDGDFNLTASADPPYPIEFKEVFTYNLKSVELGRDVDDENSLFYIGTSGTIQFEGFIKDTMRIGPIEIERLRIYSDGSIELKGGSINLIKPIVLKLGPVEITVSALHYGSHQKEVDGRIRKFNYFGFDGGISVDPLGIEIRGDGVKYYYCVDNISDSPSLIPIPKPKPYLHIQTIYLDLTIPASAPVAIINGWLSIPEPGMSKEYAGGLKLQLPKAKIAGKVDMKLMPKYPAFIIDAEIDLPAPIPIGPVAIYGFRGLMGYRYVAEKEAVGLVSGVDSWYDYYKAPPRGIHVRKFNGPDRTKLTGNPFSLGAGASLGTSFDNGTVLNIKAMVLLSIPSLFMIDGRAALISARLELEDTGEPPFFAFVAMGDDSLEFGFGADFKMPTSSGDILSLYADVQAGFFFKNQKPWYVNLGTKTNPITARILTLITIKSYVMLSAKGIEAGARGEFIFKREYGIIKVSAWAYIEVGGKISFEKPQYGAYIKAGVGVDIDIKFLSFYLAVDIMFGVEASKPFLIYGKFFYSVKIKILFVFKFEFSGDLEVIWEYNKHVDRTPINPLINEASEDSINEIVKGVNMLSNETFLLGYLAGTPPIGVPAEVTNYIIPLDTYIDIKTEKGLLPGGITDKIGGYNNPPEKCYDLVPPDKVVQGREIRQVKHQYEIVSLDLKFWDGTWRDYHPYQAMYPNDSAVNSLKIGQFQKTDGQYNSVRLMATNPFSYTEQGQPGWYVPEQYGITSASLFCAGQERVSRCADFLMHPLNEQYECGNPNYPLLSNNVAFKLLSSNQSDFVRITDESNAFNFAQSLSFDNANQMQILLPNASIKIELKLSNFANGVKVKYYSAIVNSQTDLLLNMVYGHPDPAASNQNEPYEVVKTQEELETIVLYDFPAWRAVTKIIIEPIYSFELTQQIDVLTEQLVQINNTNQLISLGIVQGEIVDIKPLENQLHLLNCGPNETEVSTYINRYTKPDSLNYYYSKEFKEGENEYFVYAIGQTNQKGLISKIATNGDIIWEKTYTITNGGKPVIFKRIIQIPSEDGQSSSVREYRYVVYANDGDKHYILNINRQNGSVRWIKQIQWNDNDVIFLIKESKNESGFYFAISDRNQIDTHRNPFVGYFDINGNLVSGSTITLPNEEFIINGIDTNENGLVLAGRYIDRDSVGIIIQLQNNLKISNPIYISNTFTTIHDIKIASNDEYLICGYDNKNNKIFVSKIINKIAVQTYILPNSIHHNSSIQLGEEGFYLLQTSEKNGLMHKFDWDMNVIWSKRIRLDEKSNGVRNFTYHTETKKLTFNAYHKNYDSLVVHTNSEMDSCLTETIGKVSIKGIRIVLTETRTLQDEKNLDLQSFEVSITTIASEKIEICPPEVKVCGKEDKILCGLYEQIQEKFDACLKEMDLNPDLNEKALCVEQILSLFNGFNNLHPYYQLQANLNTEVGILTQFISPNRSPQQMAGVITSVQTILTYMDKIGNCACQCKPKPFTLIHQVCWMSIEDYQYNENIPDQAAISADTQATIVGINTYIQPIWRPNTNYYLHFKLRDRVDDANNQDYDFVYGFSTGGPIGYFHTHDKATYSDVALVPGQTLKNEAGPDHIAVAGQVLEEANGLVRNSDGSLVANVKIAPTPDKYALTTLRQYIDYNRSYPNADGNLLRAKPLFYNDPTTQIYLFFSKAYASLFFTKWQEYGSKGALEGRLKIVIKDPTEGVLITNPPALDYYQQVTNIPQTEETWISDGNPQIPFVLSQYANMLNNPSNNCVASSEIIKPVSQFIQVTPKHLKPNKLYTAIVYNVFDINNNQIIEDILVESKDVHRFLFKTSRYATFKDQIQSFKIEKTIDGVPYEREAIFKIEKAFSSDEINGSFNTIKNLPLAGFTAAILENLKNNYQHAYDRIFEGILGLKPLDEAISTEINFIKDLNTDKVVALVVRNPEPFNNPKFPLSVTKDTLEVISDSGSIDVDYHVLFSKDYTQAIIMNNALDIKGDIGLRFKHKIYNDSDANLTSNYTVASEEIIENITV